MEILRKVQQFGSVLIAVQGAGHSFAGTPMYFAAVSQEAVK